MVITNPKGITVWVNDGFTQITGYSLAEAIGRTPGQLLQGPETNRAEVDRIGAALRACQSVTAELVNYAKDGRQFWVGMKIEPLLAANGELNGFMSMQADITARREERQALEQLSRRFNMATRAARVGAYERDANWEILWWSDMMWEIYGQDRATFKPSNESLLKVIHPEDRMRVREQVEYIARTRAPADLVFRIIRPDGEIRHLQSIGAPAYASDEGVERFRGITLDVTERVQAEERECRAGDRCKHRGS